MTLDDFRFKLVVNNKTKDPNKKSDKERFVDKVDSLVNKGMTLFESAILSDISQHEKIEYLLKAERYFVEAKRLAPPNDPSFYITYLYLGDIYIHLMNYSEAYNHYFKVKEDIEEIELMEPGSIPDECKYYVYYNIGRIKMGMGTRDEKNIQEHWEEAKRYLTIAEKAEDAPEELKDANDEALYYFLGVINLFERTDESLEKAREYFVKVLQIDPDDTYGAEPMLEKIKKEQNLRRSLKTFEDF